LIWWIDLMNWFDKYILAFFKESIEYEKTTPHHLTG
jgi:hypothetical protein